MSSMDKAAKAPVRAAVERGQVRCPRCGRLLAKTCPGARASGLELWCSGKGCKMPVLVEL